jgi:hypothetical protein
MIRPPIHVIRLDRFVGGVAGEQNVVARLWGSAIPHTSVSHTRTCIGFSTFMCTYAVSFPPKSRGGVRTCPVVVAQCCLWTGGASRRWQRQVRPRGTYSGGETLCIFHHYLSAWAQRTESDAGEGVPHLHHPCEPHE